MLWIYLLLMEEYNKVRNPSRDIGEKKLYIGTCYIASQEARVNKPEASW